MLCLFTESNNNAALSLSVHNLVNQPDGGLEPEDFRKRTLSMHSMKSARNALKRNISEAHSHRVIPCLFYVNYLCMNKLDCSETGLFVFSLAQLSIKKYTHQSLKV